MNAARSYSCSADAGKTQDKYASRYVFFSMKDVPLKWDVTPRRPIQYVIDPAMPRDLHRAVGMAFSMWSGASNGVINFVHGNIPQIRIAWNTAGNLPIPHLANTTFNTRPNTNFIESALITINATNYVWHFGPPWGVEKYKPNQGPVKRNAELLGVMAHEVGHAIGLNHSPIKCTMFATVFPGAERLAIDDIAGVRMLYGSK